MGLQAAGFYLCEAPGDHSIVNITVLLLGENQLVINVPFYNLDRGESKRVSFLEQAVHRSPGGGEGGSLSGFLVGPDDAKKNPKPEKLIPT